MSNFIGRCTRPKETKNLNGILCFFKNFGKFDHSI